MQYFYVRAQTLKYYAILLRSSSNVEILCNISTFELERRNSYVGCPMELLFSLLYLSFTYTPHTSSLFAGVRTSSSAPRALSSSSCLVLFVLRSSPSSSHHAASSEDTPPSYTHFQLCFPPFRSPSPRLAPTGLLPPRLNLLHFHSPRLASCSLHTLSPPLLLACLAALCSLIVSALSLSLSLSITISLTQPPLTFSRLRVAFPPLLLCPLLLLLLLLPPAQFSSLLSSFSCCCSFVFLLLPLPGT